jgi:hypothetical protein
MENSELARLCLLSWLVGLSCPSAGASRFVDDAARRRGNVTGGALAVEKSANSYQDQSVPLLGQIKAVKAV